MPVSNNPWFIKVRKLNNNDIPGIAIPELTKEQVEDKTSSVYGLVNGKVLKDLTGGGTTTVVVPKRIIETPLHGFVVGDALTLTGGSFRKVRASDKKPVYAVVSKVIDTSKFEYAIEGETMPIVTGTNADTLYLSNEFGVITSTKPTSGEVYQIGYNINNETVLKFELIATVKEVVPILGLFYCTITTIGETFLTFTSGVLKIKNNLTGVIKDYYSTERIVAGNYTIYGDRITSIKFNNNFFTSVTITKNDEQTNADEMFKDLTLLEEFKVGTNAFVNTTSFKETWKGTGITNFPLIDISGATILDSTWLNCSALTGFPLIDTKTITSFNKTWEGCSLIDIFPLIDTSAATELNNTWEGCTGLTSFPALDTSKVTSMDYTWYKCTGLLTFPVIDMSKVLSRRMTWKDCTGMKCMHGITNDGVLANDRTLTFDNMVSLLRPTANELVNIEASQSWVNDTPCTNNVTPKDASAFYITFTCGDGGDIGLTGKVKLLNLDTGVLADYSTGSGISAGNYDMYGTDVTSVKFNSNNFTSIHIERNGEQTDATDMFRSLTRLTNFTAKEDTFAKVTNMYSAWYYCTSLTTFPVIDTSKVTNMENAWYRCYNLVTFPLIDTSKVTNMEDTWYYCSKLTSFPAIDTSSVTNMYNAWSGCGNLTSFPKIDTSNVTNMYSAWYNCTSLTSFPAIDISNVTNMHGAWGNCTSLTCIGTITNNGTAPTNTITTFYSTNALLRPNATEQASILAGNTWVNDTQCGDEPAGVVTTPEVDTNTYTFEATFTVRRSGANISLSGTDLKLLNKGTNVTTDYTSEDPLPVGEYTIYGNGVTAVQFKLDRFTSIHIEKNSEQTTAVKMFSYLVSLKTLTAKPDTFTNVTNMDEFCTDCSEIKSFPLIDTSKVTSLVVAWQNCAALTSFPKIDTSNVTNMFSAWSECTSLESFPEIDITNVITIDQLWANCTSLVCIKGLINNGPPRTRPENMFTDTFSLQKPSDIEREDIYIGTTWTNDTPC